MPLTVALIVTLATSVVAVGASPFASADTAPAVMANGVALEGSTQGPSFTADLIPPSSDTSYVKWLLDGNYLGKDDTAPYQVSVESVSQGAHTLRARIYARDGAQTRTEATWTTSVAVGNTPMPGPVPVPVVTTAPASPPPSAATPLPAAMPSVVRVSTAVELTAALASARAGTTIHLEDGLYTAKHAFVVTGACDSGSPCVLEGGRSAVLQGGGPDGHYGLHLVGARGWTMRGFSVSSAAKGIVLDDSSHNVIDGVQVALIGDEGIHLRANSSDNVIRNSVVHDTGVTAPQYGEGIYVGSAKSNWASVTGGLPDASNRNQIVGNTIYATGAEDVDIKEGTSGGLLTGNSFDGSRMSGKNFADSWVDVKGNGWTITGNAGVNALVDGFQTHVQLPGWGQGNVFHGNVARVNSTGYGFRVQSPLTSANVVGCDNVVTGAAAGMSDVACSH